MSLIERYGNDFVLCWSVLGTPTPKGRPRTQVRKGANGQARAHIFTDDATASWESQVAWWSRKELSEAQLRMPNMGSDFSFPLDGRVIADLTFFFERPKSTPKKVRFPVKSRTDVDNLAKAVLDAIQGVVFVNDNAVTDLVVRKRFAEGRGPGVDINLNVLA